MLISLLIFGYFSINAQIKVVTQKLYLQYLPATKQIAVQQKIRFIYQDSLPTKSINLINWGNAYHSKQTDLARRFMENYDLNFHFTRDKNRGFVQLDTVILHNTIHKIDRIVTQNDIYTLYLNKAVKYNDTLSVQFDYHLKLPHKKFTGYGRDKKDNFLLDNFYFLPVGSMDKAYTHKNIDNYPEQATVFQIKLHNFPKTKQLFTNISSSDSLLRDTIKHPVLLFTNQAYNHYVYKTKQIGIWQKDQQIAEKKKKALVHKIMSYYEEKLGTYPYNKLLLTEKDFKNYKVYGPDLLPKFLNPFEKEFIWEMEILHLIGRKYFDALSIDNRKFPWISYGLPAFLEYEYLKEFYPNKKLLGKLSQYKLVKLYYASQVKMTEKYPWLYLYMARMNKDQALDVSLDSLTNFNRNVAMPYKAALGLQMIKDRQDAQVFFQKIKDFYLNHHKETFSEADFFDKIVGKETWFKHYIHTRTKYDYKLKKVVPKNDSLQLFIKQQKKSGIPVQIYGIKKDHILLLKKLPALGSDTIINVQNNRFDFIGLNYFNDYPELQNRNNYKRAGGKHLFQKPLQIRPYQDFDNPLKNQLFVNPFFEYNYYDGIIIGTEIYNESVLHNHFNYSLSPSYATKDKSLTGSFSVNYTQYFEHLKPYAIRYGFNFKYFHYDHGLAYRRINPYISMQFKDPYLRNRAGNNWVLQYMYIDKDKGAIALESDQYQVFNVNYSKFKVNVIKDLFYSADLQFAKKFGKLSGMFRYRFLTNRNRQWDFRIYAGAFLYNHTQTDYFSFALDRPTDYLFQYHYYGRSETSGIFHQQFIWAEGGFKTFFEDQYANEFIVSNNINIGVYKWFNLYGDWAWKKNRREAVGFYYDSGLRINLVQDYFEVFFPVYSNKGWEIKQPDYLSKIRMVFTIDMNGLLKMFKRGWY